MPAITDDEIRHEWQMAKNFSATARKLETGYRPIGWTEAPGFRLATRLMEGAIARLESAGVTEADIDRLGL